MIAVKRVIEIIEGRQHWTLDELIEAISKIEPSARSFASDHLQPGEHADPPSVARHEVDPDE